MDTNELYEGLLEITPLWEINRIEIDKAEKEVHVYVKYGQGIKCPECGKESPRYDERKERVWRHLDSCDYKTYIHCRQPRSKCAEHGIKTVEVPWAEALSRFTYLFESKVIDLLLANENKSKAGAHMKLSWDETNHIMARAVKRGLERREEAAIKRLGIDEKSFRRGQSYVQVLTDTDGKRVLEVVENRDEKAVNVVFQCLSEGQKAGIEGISMDFWQPYIKGAGEHIPQADIVHDKFHIMKYLNEAVDSVRKSENKRLRKEGDTTLTGAKYIYLKNTENLTEKQRTTFNELKDKRLDVNRAWARRELLKTFWECADEQSAERYFKGWYFSATHSRLQPVIKVARMLKKHINNILTYWKHFITNSLAEGINVIQHIKTARGFRNFNNYRTAILFYCGKLSLYP